MAFPILPVLVISLGLFALSRRGRDDDDDDTSEVVPATMVFIPPKPALPQPSPGQTPGRMCQASKGEAAWDGDGECKVFWIEGETDEAIAKLAREQWETRGRPSFSDMCLAVPDPLGGEFAPPQDNPLLTKIVAASLERYYDVGPEWPPTEDYVDSNRSSPFWVWKTWARAMDVVQRELCTP